MLIVITPAADTLLAPIADLRVAAGLSHDDESRDEELTALGKRISADIVEACDIAVGEGAEPTLRKERVQETFAACDGSVLILSRRHNVQVVSVEEDGIPVTFDPRGVNAESGLLERWVDGRRSFWRSRQTVVTYDAGFETVPASLVGVVADLMRIRLSDASADPLVKATTVDIEGIESVRTERWVGGLASSDGSGFPQGIMARLGRYVNVEPC